MNAISRFIEKLREENIKHKNDRNELILIESEISKIENENKLILLNIDNLQEMNNNYYNKIEDNKK